ncbi:MAG: hypothetical protein GYB53_08495 [Rhodobacteraceae bacterium]|nr:hypothetical protein [Paracoccaceae bacterium]MBR9823487.1 hypothetical protein [Paracoccaceae bacterium]
MQIRRAPIIAAMLVLAGCSTLSMDDGDAPNRVGSVPEAVAALAAPGQDLTTARLLPEDGCYWYEHSGPVETTLVPLRSAGGNPICTVRES